MWLVTVYSFPCILYTLTFLYCPNAYQYFHPQIPGTLWQCIFLRWCVNCQLVLKGAKCCSVNCLIQNADLFKSSEIMNLCVSCEKFVHAVHSLYSRLERQVFQKRKHRPRNLLSIRRWGVALLEYDQKFYPFSSLTWTGIQLELSSCQSLWYYFQKYIFLIGIIFLFFNYVSRNTH
jgi:hypothetical protein